MESFEVNFIKYLRIFSEAERVRHYNENMILKTSQNHLHFQINVSHMDQEYYLRIVMTGEVDTNINKISQTSNSSSKY